MALAGALMDRPRRQTPRCAGDAGRPAARPGRDVHRPAPWRGRRRPELDFVSYQQLVVHPHVGQLLLAQLTNYPASLARAVAEHHERLDGSGYPHALQARRAVAAGAHAGRHRSGAGRAAHGPPQLARASIALRVVPGEFDLTGSAEVAEGASPSDPAPCGRDLVAGAGAPGRAGRPLQAARRTRARSRVPQAEPGKLREALSLLAQFLLAQRLRAGWFASGLWSGAAMTVDDAAEVEAVEDELFFRLRGDRARGVAARRRAACCAGWPACGCGRRCCC
jgi:hypothetical protein